MNTCSNDVLPQESPMMTNFLRSVVLDIAQCFVFICLKNIKGEKKCYVCSDPKMT